VITTGEGGMTTTNNPDFAEKINSLRNHGSIATVSRPSPYIMSEIPCLGYNFRMSDINGAIGVAQLDKLEVLLKERRQCAEYYNEKLCDIEDIAIPFVPPRSFHTYQSYVIRILSGGVARRNKIMDRLAESEIWTRPGTHAVHCLEYYRHKYGLQPLTYPNSKCAEDTSITLPIFFGMSKDNFSFIIKALKNALNN
jgi:dTDP-4-amino-4,6-dideoxygalactose transaminase